MKRKVKSMKAILEEFPDSYFDHRGCLCIEGVPAPAGMNEDSLYVMSEDLVFLGDYIVGHNLWDERLLEPLPGKKRLYAYRNDGRHVVFTSGESPVFRSSTGGMYTRTPEYDIVYNEEEE